MPLSPSVEEEKRWLALARASIGSHWQKTELPHLELGQQVADVFVSLHIDGQLRGCIGATDNDQSLQESIGHLARRCAFADPRFPPLTETELAWTQISISVLGPKRRLPVHDQQELIAAISPGDGLLLKQGGRQALFLPQVWEGVHGPGEFVAALLHKGGWSTWPEEMRAWKFDCLVLQEGLEH
ncbi:AmmeMemoRadiSam system protein A [Marinobacter hydrocarbonoclasticus]|nr:AmmeMemoRadiSam system protein A [Marinobacter nauticus]